MVYRIGALRAGVDLQVWEKMHCGTILQEMASQKAGTHGVRALLVPVRLKLLKREGSAIACTESIIT